MAPPAQLEQGYSARWDWQLSLDVILSPVCHCRQTGAVDNSDEITNELLAAVFPWRVVGIPKKDENESRPIGVVSCLVRCWLSALAAALPEVADNQWACRKETSVVHAIADWLAADGSAGSEMDLSKAYDNISHELAAEAFVHECLPRVVISICQLAWRSPRICCVDSELSSPIWPTKDLPQGDSCALHLVP